MTRPAPDKTLATLDRCATVAGGWAEKLWELDATGPTADVIARAAALLDNVDEICTAFYLASTGVVIPGAATSLVTVTSERVTRRSDLDRLRAGRARTAGRLRFYRIKIQRLVNARRCGCGPPAPAEFSESLFG